MADIREEFLSYLTDDLGYAEEECKKAWERAQKDFPSYDIEDIGGLLTLEVVTRDILRGEYNEKISERWELEHGRKG